MININKIFFVIIVSLFYLTKGNALIQDSLFATVGNRAVTQSDIREDFIANNIEDMEVWNRMHKS